ncbi:MAG: YceI family protein [Bacteriovoracaceae bacterium]
MKLLLTFALLLSGPVMAKSLTIDKGPSKVGFEIMKNKIKSIVPGEFKDFEGTFDYDAKTKTISNVTATIKVNSVDTQSQKRDDHLKQDDFFAAKKFPTIVFKSTGTAKLSSKGSKKPLKFQTLNVADHFGEIKGNLTLRGETKPVTLNFYDVKTSGDKVSFKAVTQIDRSQFKLDWNHPLEKKDFFESVTSWGKKVLGKNVLSNEVDVLLTISSK